ncbi:DNA polymerase III subunit beta [Alicyclobacillus sp. SO9]|uniref:DNA polymerase III subunit beta n=1 Tax=Alicyclobacillus sp. SO9 TaxID=2665646 RepID=UPI0018E8A6FF|nr:DNA polymerase III subunit beta [Alicyclobacillus sp. SO9]QQE80029.1 DNA polymerase III subunit beta [Alicyclobacillus sp. SO9]
MEFKMNRMLLASMLHAVSSGLATRTPHQILTGVLLQVTETSVEATAYNLETGVRQILPVELDEDIMVITPGSVVAPAKQLMDLIRKLTGTHVTVSCENAELITLSSNQFECNLHGFDAEAFPQLPNLSGAVQFSLTAPVLKSLITSTAFAASKQEARPVLTGIYIELANGLLRFSCTDSLRLATQAVPLETDVDTLCAIIPAKSMVELAHLLPDNDQTIFVTVANSHCSYTIGNLQFYTRIIEGAFVEVTRLIPSVHMTEVTIRTQSLLHSLDCATVIAPQSQEIQVLVEKGTVLISTESAEYGDSKDVLDAVSVSGGRSALRLNAKNVLEALRTCKSEDVVLRFTGKNRPLIVVPNDDTNLVHVISPIVSR